MLPAVGDAALTFAGTKRRAFVVAYAYDHERGRVLALTPSKVARGAHEARVAGATWSRALPDIRPVPAAAHILDNYKWQGELPLEFDAFVTGAPLRGLHPLPVAALPLESDGAVLLTGTDRGTKLWVRLQDRALQIKVDYVISRICAGVNRWTYEASFLRMDTDETYAVLQRLGGAPAFDAQGRLHSFVHDFDGDFRLRMSPAVALQRALNMTLWATESAATRAASLGGAPVTRKPKLE